MNAPPIAMMDQLDQPIAKPGQLPADIMEALQNANSMEEIEAVMRDLRAHDVNMLTLGQYLQPSRHHLPVSRYVTPEEFEQLRVSGEAMGFSHVASGPMVRSSYHADLQADGVLQDAVSA